MAKALTLALLCGAASGLSASRRRMAPRSVVKMEDFGLLKGTPFSFSKEWGGEDCISERKLENYMNDKGLRFKMNKTPTEREGMKLGGGAFPEFSFKIPLLNVDVNIGPPETESVWEALGFTATSNNAAEKKNAIAKEKKAYDSYGELVSFWRQKYGYTKYVPGSWFYADQLTTDDEELRSTSGFRMRKGGFYPDGTRDTRK